MSPQDKIILLSSKIHLSKKELEELNAQVALVSDWDEVVKNLIALGVGPLFYKKLSLLSNYGKIPATVQAQLKQSYYRTLTRGMVLSDVFRKVIVAFARNDIKVVALKGIHLSEWLYGDIGLRQFLPVNFCGVNIQQVGDVAEAGELNIAPGEMLIEMNAKKYQQIMQFQHLHPNPVDNQRF